MRNILIYFSAFLCAIEESLRKSEYPAHVIFSVSYMCVYVFHVCTSPQLYMYILHVSGRRARRTCMDIVHWASEWFISSVIFLPMSQTLNRSTQQKMKKNAQWSHWRNNRASCENIVSRGKEHLPEWWKHCSLRNKISLHWMSKQGIIRAGTVINEGFRKEMAHVYIYIYIYMPCFVYTS